MEMEAGVGPTTATTLREPAAAMTGSGCVWLAARPRLSGSSAHSDRTFCGVHWGEGGERVSKRDDAALLPTLNPRSDIESGVEHQAPVDAECYQAAAVLVKGQGAHRAGPLANVGNNLGVVRLEDADGARGKARGQHFLARMQGQAQRRAL